MKALLVVVILIMIIPFAVIANATLIKVADIVTQLQEGF